MVVKPYIAKLSQGGIVKFKVVDWVSIVAPNPPISTLLKDIGSSTSTLNVLPGK